MALNLEAVEGVAINGLMVSKLLITSSKKEEDLGKIQLVLEAQKDEVACGAYTLGDVVAALNAHQEGQHPVVIKVLMPTNVRPDPTRVASDQTQNA